MTETITGRVVRTERIGSTRWGNPMYWVGIEDASGHDDVYRLSNDAGLAYAITNPEYRDTPHTFELTKAGRLSGVVVRAKF